MDNAEEEFLRFLRDINFREIKCAWVETKFEWVYFLDTEDERIGVNIIQLKNNFTRQDYEKFVNELDFDYDSGFGSQKVYGYIWFEDGTWAERGEYDGSEWWEHKECPEIPKELL